MPALSAESFEQAYREIATRCSVPENPKEDLKKSVQRYLSSSSAGEWLLVVDNVDEQEILFGTQKGRGGMIAYFPESEHGLTLFTTRYRKIAVSLADTDVVEVQEMDDQEAETFFKKSLIQELRCNEVIVAELLKELTYLPLAIAQAAAYINSTNVSVQVYLSLLQNTEQNTVSLLSREFHDNTRHKESNAIATTWLVSFNQIRRSDPDAADVLCYISCIEGRAIPLSILPSVQPEEQMIHAIGTLSGYAFLTRRGNTNCYDMHRLVHLATKVWMNKWCLSAEWRGKTAFHLAEIFPSDDYQNRAIWREYFPHALHFLRDTEDWGTHQRADLCLKVGKCLGFDGRVREAIVWLSECFLWDKEQLTEDHPIRSTSQHELARAYLADGQIEKAIKLLEQVVTMKKEVLAEDHPSRLTSQHQLARAYNADGQLEEAIMLMQHVVAIREKVVREDHPYRLKSERLLSDLYEQQRSNERTSGSG